MIKKVSSVVLLLAAAPACHTARTDPEPSATPPALHSEVNAAKPTEAPTSQSNSGASHIEPSLSVAGLGTCQPAPELTNLASRAVQLADTDGNGQVSRQEAQSMADLLVGGSFFRADENADGTVTPQEGRALRTELIHDHPTLAATLARARQATGQTPFKSIAQLLDLEYGKPLTVAEARAAAKTVVSELYTFADSNNDGVISRDEALLAGNQGAQALGRQIFAAADADHDQSLSRSEFAQAVSASAEPVFQMFDTNKDGRLTELEAAAAINAAGLRLGLPELATKG